MRIHIFSCVFLAFLFSGKVVIAQQASDYRCVFFNEKIQKMNFSDSTLNLLSLFNAKELGVYLNNKRDPKAKVLIQEMVVTINRVKEKMTEYHITGNKIAEGAEFYEEFKLCVPGDKIYVDHVVFKTVSGEIKSFNRGFVLVLK